MSFTGKAITLRFPVPGSVRFRVSDDDGKTWRKPTTAEKEGPLNDAVDAFVLTLIEGGELERVHTEEGERPYYEGAR